MVWIWNPLNVSDNNIVNKTARSSLIDIHQYRIFNDQYESLFIYLNKIFHSFEISTITIHEKRILPALWNFKQIFNNSKINNENFFNTLSKKMRMFLQTIFLQNQLIIDSGDIHITFMVQKHFEEVKIKRINEFIREHGW